MTGVTVRALDILFVLHQDTSLERLRNLCSDAHAIGFLTTHGPYPSELGAWQGLSSDVRIMTFADFLDDQAMAGCDDEASACTLAQTARVGRKNYFRRFMQESLRRKNERVRDRVLSEYRIGRIYMAEGLGIDSIAWRDAGGVPIPAAPVLPPKAGVMAKIRRSLGHEAHLLLPMGRHHGRQPVLLLGSIKRLRLIDDVRIKRLQVFPWGVAPIAIMSAILDYSVKRLLPGRTNGPGYTLCTTIHQYHADMSQLAARQGTRLQILLDGHHPSNFPASYIDGMGEGDFVADNHCSVGWFTRHGREVVPGLWFQRPVVFRFCDTAVIRRVMLVLNHAGDWTALINRSDTDELIKGFVGLAARFPSLEFVVRMHPTMALPEHEGVNSMRRIRDFLSGAGVGNLSVSDASLDEDLRRGDVYISEYSQVLIDAWGAGKLGLVVNPTRRRSFMSDYEVLGFHAVDSVVAMHQWLAALLADLPGHVATHNLAVERFNAAQTAWAGG